MFRYWDPEMSLVALFDAKFKGLTHNITRKISLVNLNHTIFLILGGFNPPLQNVWESPRAPLLPTPVDQTETPYDFSMKAKISTITVCLY
jgi:hypothetical protein